MVYCLKVSAVYYIWYQSEVEMLGPIGPIILRVY